jgi:hypothetical protein
MSKDQHRLDMQSSLYKRPDALALIESAIDRKERLPKNVFRPGWGAFHLFDSDWIFEGAFVEKARAIMLHEGAGCAYIVNLDREADAESAAFVIDSETTAQDYQRRLSGAGPGDGWVYDIARFVCISDKGSWCIYCERASELAIIGFRIGTTLEWYRFILASLHASKAATVGASPRRYEFPSHIISSTWKEEIIRNYGPE